MGYFVAICLHIVLILFSCQCNSSNLIVLSYVCEMHRKLSIFTEREIYILLDQKSIVEKKNIVFYMFKIEVYCMTTFKKLFYDSKVLELGIRIPSLGLGSLGDNHFCIIYRKDWICHFIKSQ